MKPELNYVSTLNGAAFLFFEFRQVLQLRGNGLSDKEIRKKVVQENIFQMDKLTRINRVLPSVMHRVNVLDDRLGKLAIEESVQVGKTVNLYAIMKTDRLFFEFMNEVIKDKFLVYDYLLEKKDLNSFFTFKAVQSEKVSSWSESNVDKLKRVYMQILFESGLLRTRTSGELHQLLIDERVSEHLNHIGDIHYIHAIGV